MTVEESLSMFLHVIAHNLKFRVIKVIYIRSTETISRHFSMLLNGILRLADDYIKVPDSTTDVGTEDKWRWFKDCYGALDGTFVPVTVPTHAQCRYRKRK